MQDVGRLFADDAPQTLHFCKGIEERGLAADAVFRSAKAYSADELIGRREDGVGALFRTLQGTCKIGRHLSRAPRGQMWGKMQDVHVLTDRKGCGKC